MIKDQVFKTIKQHEQELTKFHVESIYLFGSVARGEDGPDSDIDFLVSFQGEAKFNNFMDLKFFLEDLLKRKVDLVTQGGLRAEIKDFVKQDLIRAA